MAPGGAPTTVDAAEPPTESPSPPSPKSTLPTKTPKSAFGRAFDSFRTAWGLGGGSSRGPASEEDEEGSLDGSGGVYQSQVGELRSIVGDLVEAADRDEEMEIGGPERLEFGTPEAMQFEEESDEEASQGRGLAGEGFLDALKETVFEQGESAIKEAIETGQKAGSVIAAKAKTAAFDLNEAAMELADAAVGVSAADVADDVTRSAADLANDVTALGGAVEVTAGRAANALTGNIGEALADELGAVHTRPAAAKSSVETRPTRGGAKLEGGKERGNGKERRGSKRKAPESGKGKGKVTDSETEDEGGAKRGRLKRRFKQAGSEVEVEPRAVEFAPKFGGEVEVEDEPNERGGKRTPRAVVDPRDGEDMSAGLRRYNLRKSTL